MTKRWSPLRACGVNNLTYSFDHRRFAKRSDSEPSYLPSPGSPLKHHQIFETQEGNKDNKQQSSVLDSSNTEVNSTSLNILPIEIQSPAFGSLIPLDTLDRSELQYLLGQQFLVERSDTNSSPCLPSSDLLSSNNFKHQDISQDWKIDRLHQLSKMTTYRGPGVSHLAEINTFPPFLSPIAGKRPCHWGVIKITNIPYSVTIQEVSHFIGRLSRGPLLTPHTHGYPVHIIIERPTGKTLEVFVEFQTVTDAHACVLSVENHVLRGKPLKIGQRHVGVEMSDQGELMSQLFPRAKCVYWDPVTGAPHVVEQEDESSEGFRGFFTIEEMASIVKHAETPQRSPFSARCMQRTYESMISTLYKFPWLSTNRYTVAARDFLFTSYMAQLRVLLPKVAPLDDSVGSYSNRRSGSIDREVGLSHNLLMDMLFAGLNAVCFSMRQKWQIIVNCGSLGKGFPISELAFAWPFQCLSPPVSAPDDSLEFWLNILVDGFDMMHNNGLNHGFEKYIKVQRDNCGFLLFEFTHVGHGLHFQEALVLEQTLMTQMVEKGRMKWCMDHQFPYQSLGLEQSFPNVETDNDLASGLDSLRLHENSASGGGDMSGGSNTTNSLVVRDETPIEDGRSIDSEAYSRQFEAMDRALETFKKTNNVPHKQYPTGNAAGGRAMYMRRSPQKGSRQFAIDPRTPEFVPSQPWTGMSGSTYRSDDVLQDETTLTPAGTAFTDPFTGRPIPQPRPIRRSSGQSPIKREGSVGSGGSDKTLLSTAYHSPARGRSSSDRSVDKPDGLISTASKTPTRRKTINVDTTIDEENEAGHEDHTGGGVRLKSYSHGGASSRYDY